jgi:hypothetical protein
MKKVILVLIAIFVVAMIFGLVMLYTIKHIETKAVAEKNLINLPRVKSFQTIEDVLAIMGTPQKVEGYALKDGKLITFFLYRIRPIDFSLRKYEDDFIPIAIESNRNMVLSLDKSYYYSIRKIKENEKDSCGR